MSPLREEPVDLHLLGLQQSGKLKVADPLKSFLRVVQKRLGWRIHSYGSDAELVAAIEASEHPPHFFCVKDRHMVPQDILASVAGQGGYLNEGLPTDALSLYKALTTTQIWTIACTDDQLETAQGALHELWKASGLREEPHAQPRLVKPPKRDDYDIGGGFGSTSFNPGDDSNWDELSDDEDSSDDEPSTEAKPEAKTDIDVKATMSQESATKPAV